MEDLNESLDSFDEEVRRFDKEFEAEKMLNKEKFKGLILDVPEVYDHEDAEFAEIQMK